MGISDFSMMESKNFNEILRIFFVLTLTFSFLAVNTYAVCPDTSSPGAYGWLEDYTFTLAGSQERFYLGTQFPNPIMTGYGDTIGADQTGLEFIPDQDNFSMGTIELKIHVVQCSSGPCSKNLKWNAWIDFNDDKIFQENEKVIRDSMELPSGDNVVEYPVEIPAGAFGERKLRVNLAYSYQNDKDSDAVFCYGDVEDYIIDFSPGSKPIPEYPFQMMPGLIAIGGYLLARIKKNL